MSTHIGGTPCVVVLDRLRQNQIKYLLKKECINHSIGYIVIYSIVGIIIFIIYLGFIFGFCLNCVFKYGYIIINII